MKHSFLLAFHEIQGRGVSVSRIFAILLLFILVPIQENTGSMIMEPDWQGMLRFLRSQYVESIGLLRAATRAYPDNITIYIANDNVLAARALAVFGDHELSSRILNKLNKEYGGGLNNRIEILFGMDIPDIFNDTINELLAEIDGYRIVYERRGSQTMLDWYEYADLLVYGALDKLLSGSRSDAELLFLNLTKMWDGYGFRDKAFNSTGIYATYKCALFIYLYRALEASSSNVTREYAHIMKKCHEIIAFAQDPVTGGIRTDYRVLNNRLVIEGDVNVETTSIVVLALYSEYPLMIGSYARKPSSIEVYDDSRTVIYILLLIAQVVILVFNVRVLMKLLKHT